MRSPKVSAFSPALARSKRRALRGVAGSVRAATASAARPTGRFTRNSHGHDATDRIAAATVGPAAEAMATIIATLPTPRPISPWG